MLEPEIVMEKSAYTIPPLERKRQLLVVDDNQAVQEVLSETLSFLGYDVTIADNGIEGGTLFLSGSYDLVVTALDMPLMNGRELSRLIKERSPNTPVLVISGAGDEMHWKEMNMRCVDAIILKPFMVEDIKETVQRLLNS